DFVITHSI
ncbi:unnamed protein product, partial [Allacma fusca]